MITCKKCGELNGSSRSACYKCGEVFGEDEGKVIKCGSCGNLNGKDEKVCVKCGKNLDERVTAFKKCPNCGKEFTLKSTICDKCGYDLIVTGNVGVSLVTPSTTEKIKWWQWLIAAFIPLVGIIMGIAMISTHNEESTENGKTLIIGSIVLMFAVPAVFWFLMLILSIF